MKYSRVPLTLALLALGAAGAPAGLHKLEARGETEVCYDPRDPRVPPLQNDPNVEKWIDKETGHHCFALMRGVQPHHPCKACKGHQADLYLDHIHCLAAGHVHASKGDSCEATHQARLDRYSKALEGFRVPDDTDINKSKSDGLGVTFNINDPNHKLLSGDKSLTQVVKDDRIRFYRPLGETYKGQGEDLYAKITNERHRLKAAKVHNAAEGVNVPKAPDATDIVKLEAHNSPKPPVNTPSRAR
ncbi:hypothetical protein PspLS_07541 [Pyricularia sp. CBS 133598]|nr:hypothetical protein PspLS_07541 [Pyricularia sp. CBS 133598]